MRTLCTVPQASLFARSSRVSARQRATASPHLSIRRTIAFVSIWEESCPAELAAVATAARLSIPITELQSRASLRMAMRRRNKIAKIGLPDCQELRFTAQYSIASSGTSAANPGQDTGRPNGVLLRDLPL